MEPLTVRHISDCFVKPKRLPEEWKRPYYLSPWDLVMLTVQYIQKGLLFAKPSGAADQRQDFMEALLERLKDSLSLTLVHFYPLAGRLVTLKEDSPSIYSVFVDCNDSPGARFIHAAADMTVADVVSPAYVPLIVQSFFDHDRAVNHDGHTRPLLSIQVTELIDGVFIGMSANHSLVDGTSFWHFFNSWSDTFQAQEDSTLRRPPLLERWFPEGYGPIINLPFRHTDEFVSRYESPQLKERIFHFSPESIKQLKERANKEASTDKISSFQSLSALLWRCVTRVRKLPYDEITSCRLAADNRSRLQPPLSPNYFGNSLSVVRGAATAGELLESNLGWAAWRLHQAVVNHTNAVIREWVKDWLSSPHVYQIHRLFDPRSVMMGSSPRFDKYGSEFGMGKPIAVRSGYAHKFDGKVSAYPGREGGGSIDLEVCLLPEFMEAIEADEEFLAVTS